MKWPVVRYDGSFCVFLKPLWTFVDLCHAISVLNHVSLNPLAGLQCSEFVFHIHQIAKCAGDGQNLRSLISDEKINHRSKSFKPSSGA